MKNFLDLAPLLTVPFPEEAMLSGLANTPWLVSTFYDDIHHQAPLRWPLDGNASRKWNHLFHKLPITEYYVSLTQPRPGIPRLEVKLDEPSSWELTPASANFTAVLAWIRLQPILSALGRVTIFITQGSEPPIAHRDFVRSKPEDGDAPPVEFLWFSGPVHGFKNMEVAGVPRLTSCCWFNDKILHRALPNAALTWSIRFDGPFLPHIKALIA